MKKFNIVSFVLRFLAALVVVLATFNPSGYSYFHWCQDSLASTGTGIGAEHAFVGVVLLIGWTVLVRSTLRALGAFGLLLAASFIGTAVWLMTSYGLFAADSSTSITWTALISLSALLAVGMSWSHIRKRLSGQLDVDNVNDLGD